MGRAKSRVQAKADFVSSVRSPAKSLTLTVVAQPDSHSKRSWDRVATLIGFINRGWDIPVAELDSPGLSFQQSVDGNIEGTKN